MKDFEFSFPTHVVFGRGAEKRAGELAVPCGKKALLCYGSQRIKQSGLLGSICAQLALHAIACVEFGGISENPTVHRAEEGCRLARRESVDFLLAIGGGSIIDAAKAISVGACYSGPLWDLYDGSAQPQEALPLGVVLTMAATASEANRVSVLHHPEKGIKRALSHPLLYPKFALMDPELTYTVPPYQTAAGSVDIFSHAFERYFHKEQSGTLRDALCESVMRTVVQELPNALVRPEGYDARSQLMWAATVAHSDMLGPEGDFACHALSHVLTLEFGLPHGAALGILMVAWCKYMLGPEPEAIAKFSVRVWDVAPSDNVGQVAQNGISKFQSFLCSAGLPVTLREAGANSVDVAKLTAMAGTPVGNGFFRALTGTDVMGILQLATG